MKEVAIRNGHVIDPANGVNEEKDVLIRDGKVVDELNDPKGAKEIDASGKLVVPGGVCPHSHIAGPKSNVGRLLRPEDGRKGMTSAGEFGTGGEFPESGFSLPNTYATGYRYARMGYTTVVEPSLAPIEARHTHEELNDTPILDKAALPEVGNNWMMMQYLAEGDTERAAAFAAWLIWATKGYGLKLVNPCGVEQWSQDGGTVTDLDQVVEPFGCTSRDMIEGVMELNEMLGLPHSVHLHANNLGVPGNVETLLDSMELARGRENDDRAVLHATHVQFNSYGGDSWKTMSSEGLRTADFVNSNDNVTVDPAVVTFKDTTTMTGDAPFEYNLQKMMGGKYVGSDIGLEGGGGVVPFDYEPDNPIATVQWATGLESALGVEDPWQVFLTTDHPNAAPFTDYPLIMSWLASAEERERITSRVHPIVNKGTAMGTIDREYTLEELIVISRAAPAKAYTFGDKGHLGPGADADVAVFDLDPESFDPSRQHQELRDTMEFADYTLKNGEIVAKEGEVVAEPDGSTHWVDARGAVEDHVMEDVMKDIETHFENYTMELANYPVQDHYVENGEKREVSR